MKSMLPKPDNANELRGLKNQIKLILRLMGDQRVNPVLKFLPVVSVLYLVFPDFLPGPFDDAVIIGLGLYTFVELCPNDVVDEHRAALAAENQRRSKVVDAED